MRVVKVAWQESGAGDLVRVVLVQLVGGGGGCGGRRPSGVGRRVNGKREVGDLIKVCRGGEPHEQGCLQGATGVRVSI